MAQSYKNPPIEEAMCEFTFAAVAPGAQWDLTLPGRIQQHPNIRNVYDGPSRQQHVQQVIAEAASPANFALSTALLRVILPTPDNAAVLGIGPNTLSVSSMKPYEGWSRFRPRIETALAAYREVARPSQIERITLKYVNRIVAPSPGAATAAQYLGDMAASHDFELSDGVIVSARLNGYNYRKEFLTPDKAKILVTQATIEPANPATSEFLLDIELLLDETLQFQDATVKLEALHATEGAVFESFITDEARRLFNAN